MVSVQMQVERLAVQAPPVPIGGEETIVGGGEKVGTGSSGGTVFSIPIIATSSAVRFYPA